MEFASKRVKFSLQDVGSEIIDQLATDVYTTPESIFREIVKNAYDAYLGLDDDDLEEESFQRQIVISRTREEQGKIGRIMITDRGIGQTLEDVRANVQISISRKQEELGT